MAIQKGLKSLIVISQGLLLVVTLILYYIFRREYWVTDFWDGSMGLAQIFYAGLVIGVGIRIFSLVMIEALPGYAQVMERTVVDTLKGIDNWDLLLVSLPPAIIEELAFRGFLQPFIGVWLTSLVFAILHWGFVKELWAYGFHAFVISLLLGWVYIATGSLLTTMIAHFVNNLLAGLYVQDRMIF